LTRYSPVEGYGREMSIEMHTTSNNFYIAVLLYESASDKPAYQPLYEECFVLIEARSEEKAREKALQYAGKPNSYKNQQGEVITWQLKHLVDVSRVLSDSFYDGTELYARHFRNYKAYHSFEPLLSNEEL
jgi:hypothetical protein